VPDFLSTLARLGDLSARGVPNWLSTHPEPAERVIEAKPVAATFAGGNASERGRERYRDRIDGVAVGDRREDGIVRGHRFLHPMLRFALDFPEGWELTNTPEQVAAEEPGQKHYMFLQHVENVTGGSLDQIAMRSMSNARFRHLDGQLTSLNGANAYVGTYQGELNGIGRVTMRAAHIANGRQVFVLAGFAPEGEFARIEQPVANAIRSYRPLSQREADEVEPNRLAYYVVQAGDSWQSIAARGRHLARASDLAIMNNYEVNQQPRPGERIKIVVEG
jgi:predicted Zn-dependent protease